MRLLFLTNHYPPHTIGSYDQQCHQVAGELIRRGHRVGVITSKPPTAISHFLAETHVLRELEPYPERHDKDHSFQWLHRLVKANRKAFDHALVQYNPEAIMVWGMHRLPASLLQMAEASGLPRVHAIHDSWLGRLHMEDRWLTYWTEEDASNPLFAKSLLRAFRLDRMVMDHNPLGEPETLRWEHVCFGSHWLKQETCRQSGLPLQGAGVIPCGISLAEIRRRTDRSAKIFRILFFGLFHEENDPITLLKAFQELRRGGEDRFNLDLYGRGTPDYEAALHDFVRRFQLGGSVQFRPLSEQQARDNLPYYDAMVLTSRYPEIFPMVELAAMAAGVPIVASRTHEAEGLLRNEETGLLFEPGNFQQLSECLNRLANDANLEKNLADNGRNEILRNRTLERITSRFEETLKNALSSE